MKKKEQVLYVLGAIVLLAVLYFGFDINPSTHKALEKSRALNTEEYDITSYQAEAKKSLKEDDIKYLETLEAQVQHAGQDSSRLNSLKLLSGYWYKLGNPVMAGLYAREVAEKENSAQSWSIAGTTFASGLQQDLEEKQKLFLRNQALAAFESARTKPAHERNSDAGRLGNKLPGIPRTTLPTGKASGENRTIRSCIDTDRTGPQT